MFNEKSRFKRTTLICCASLAFLIGLAGGRRGWYVSIWLAGIVTVLAVLTYRKGRWATLLAVVSLGMIAGVYRGASFASKLEPYKLLYGRDISAQVIATTDGVYEDGQLSFDAGSIKFVSPIVAEVPGSMKLKGRGVNAVFRGDHLKVSGKLYATRGSKQSGVSFANIEIMQHQIGWVDNIRLKFAAGMRNSLPEPVASFGLGLLMGQRTSLPESVLNSLSIVGLTHIIAVSGYNLTIIIDKVRRRMSKYSKYQSVVISGMLMFVFVLMTGFSASIVRASLVSSLGLLTWYYGHNIKPLVLLTLTAALTAGYYPLYLWSDVGWWLSFLAFFGVLVIAPLIIKLWEQKGRKLNTVNSIIIESLCAQIMTAPLIMLVFQRFSLIGIVSNVLTIPLVPLAMLLTLISGVAGMIIPVLSGIVGWPAKVLLTYMLDLAQVMSGAPNAEVKQSLPLAGLVAMYAVVVSFTLWLWRRTRKLDIISKDKMEINR
jgi:competence protein ComEC